MPKQDIFAWTEDQVIKVTGTDKIIDKVNDEVKRSGILDRVGGPADAYRHLLISAELTRLYGQKTGDILGKAHEERNDLSGDQTAEDSKMDGTKNNPIGVKIGTQAKSWDDVVAGARKEIEAGAKHNGEGTNLAYRVNADTRYMLGASSRRSKARHTSGHRPLPRFPATI